MLQSTPSLPWNRIICLLVFLFHWAAVVRDQVPAIPQYGPPGPTQSKLWVNTAELAKLINQWYMPKEVKYTKEGTGTFEFSLNKLKVVCDLVITSVSWFPQL